MQVGTGDVQEIRQYRDEFLDNNYKKENRAGLLGSKICKRKNWDHIRSNSGRPSGGYEQFLRLMGAAFQAYRD